MAPLDDFRARVTRALNADGWVVDGSYSKVRDLVWGQAETLVWLDYSLPLILGRLAWRTLRRVLSREELWNGNREKLLDHFTRDSLFLWAIQQHPRHRREYPACLAKPEYAHLTLIRFRTPRATEAWLSARAMSRTL
jgi:hypothetical protein